MDYLEIEAPACMWVVLINRLEVRMEYKGTGGKQAPCCCSLLAVTCLLCHGLFLLCNAPPHATLPWRL